MRQPRDPSLNAVLDPLIDDLRGVLGDDLVGLYLYGSAVTGGFEPGVSDIDLIAVTHSAATELDLRALDAVHSRVIARDPSWTDRLEIVYVARSTLAASIGQDSVAVISPGEPFHLTGTAADWLMNWYLARQTGVALIGPPAIDVFAPISQREFLAAVKAYLEYLRTAKSLGYAVLSACRGVRTLETGQPCSKQDGASWAKGRWPDWAWLIDLALADRMSRGTGGGFDHDQTRRAARQFIDLLAARASRPTASSGE